MTQQQFEPIPDPLEVPRALTAVSMEIVTKGWEKEAHAHPKAQLVLAVRGLVTCEIEQGLWIVPARAALWIPGSVVHSIRAAGEVELYCLFLDPELTAALPERCCTLTVSPLLRELIAAVSRLPALYDPDGRAGPLIQAMLGELADAPVERLHLPMPADPRLRRVADALAADPADRATVAGWAARVAMSERSFHRAVLHETGMTFGRWRQQFQIVFALERLAQGASVQSVSLDLGYEGASAFITMFRKAMGRSPGRYLPGREADTSA